MCDIFYLRLFHKNSGIKCHILNRVPHLSVTVLVWMCTSLTSSSLGFHCYNVTGKQFITWCTLNVWCVYCLFRVFDWAGAHGEEVWWNWLLRGRAGDQEVKGQSWGFSLFSVLGFISCFLLESRSREKPRKAEVKIVGLAGRGRSSFLSAVGQSWSGSVDGQGIPLY